MRRRLLLLVVYLLLGATITVQVAWACALWADPPKMYETRVRDGSARWGVFVPADWPPKPGAVFRGAGGGYAVRGAQAFGRRPVPDWPGRFWPVVEHRVEVHETGWPARSLHWEHRISPAATTGRYAITLPPVVTRFTRADDRALPLRPLWPGFVIDTLLFAAAAWLVLDGPRAVIRARRGWQGRCAGCGYDLRGSTAGCPECGAGR